MEILITAFLLGLMGSFHCIGMCGPIALSLPLRGVNVTQKITGGLLYNLGRATTYAVMGGLFGLIGKSFSMIGFQQWTSVIIGSFMIASVLFPLLFKTPKLINTDFFAIPLRRAIQQLFKERSSKGLFLIGIGNGLLPCGLVYLAIAGAIGAASLSLGMAFMVLFGLGTIPMMMLISLIGNFVTVSIRNKMNKVVPYLVVVIGVIFILRGLTLGIPYLSPPKEKLTPDSHPTIANQPTTSDALKNACCEPNNGTDKMPNAK